MVGYISYEMISHMTELCSLGTQHQHLSDKIWFSIRGKSDRYVSIFLKLMKGITKPTAQYFQSRLRSSYINITWNLINKSKFRTKNQI